MSRERTIWMFPRNIRRTDAWKVAQILSLFEAAIREGTTKSEIEKGFIKNLKKANLQAPLKQETRILEISELTGPSSLLLV